MNNKALVRLSNVIGIVSIILLVYWTFIFISITVFGVKVFRGKSNRDVLFKRFWHLGFNGGCINYQCDV